MDVSDIKGILLWFGFFCSLYILVFFLNLPFYKKSIWEKVKYNEKCTTKTEGILKKWEEYFKLERGYVWPVDSHCISLIYFLDGKGKEHCIDLIENILINRKITPSGTKFTIYFNPKNPDNYYIEIGEQHKRLLKKIFCKRLVGMICLNIIALVPYGILSRRFNLQFFRKACKTLDSFLLCYYDMIIILIAVNILPPFLIHKDFHKAFEKKCTKKVKGIVDRWEEHKIPSGKSNRLGAYLAIVTYKDDNGNVHTVDVSEKKHFNHRMVNRRTEIPLLINPNNEYDVCVDYKTLLKQIPELKKGPFDEFRPNNLFKKCIRR